jgi:hypothetical protein
MPPGCPLPGRRSPGRDEIVIYRVITSDAAGVRPFLATLKQRLKVELEQEEILIVERDVETL